MSINSILGTGLSALAANQQAMKATSTNVANVNTVGYSRLDAQFVTRQSSGGMMGVEVQITRVANAYLAAAEMRGAADVSAADMLAQFMDRAQGLMGDPSNSGSVFATLDPVFQSFGALAVDPASALRRSETLSDVRTLLAQLQNTFTEISALRDEANSRVVSAMEEANSLMTGIARLNASIQRSTIGGTSASEAETEQQRMLDRLSEIIDIRVQQRPLGGVEVRTTDGLLLVDVDAGRFGLASDANGAAFPGATFTPPRTTNAVALESHLQGGEIKGLLRVRDKEIPDLLMAFGEFAAGVSDALNAAHNTGTAVPPPTQLTGRNTGLVATDRLNFTGSTNIAVVNSDGMVVRNVRVDFGAGTVTDDLGNTTSFANSVGDFTAALNGALDVYGQASFAGGQLQIRSNVSDAGVAITDDPTSPATRAGKGFSHAFGLNDLVVKGTSPLSYATGLSGADPHGFGVGETMTIALRNSDGSIARTVQYTVAGATVADLRAGLDAALAGYATTTFDASGRMSFNLTNADISRVDVIGDTTQRGDTGLSVSALFGFGEGLPAERARGLAIRTDINGDPGLIAAARADLVGVLNNQRALSEGDGRGALALEAAESATRQFQTAGGLTAQVTSVADYAARLAGHAGGKASALEASRAAAVAVREEVRSRRQGEEGVNLDEELVKMTTYQQAYSAASRMITAARDMYDILLSMV